jgi:serine/threonine-protein kinase
VSVSAERWAQIKSVLANAMELPTDERERFVEQACGDDMPLRSEVHSLLSAADGPTPFAHVLAADSTNKSVATSDSVSELLTLALGHQYEIIRELGRGGMGAVYLAREKALERLVAIKVLRPELAASPESRERFRREARIAANLSHPGILQLHTFGEITGVWYFVMSYVRGETLADVLRRRGRLPPNEAHQILIELADALACAHRYHVVHRDIKPANVLIDAESGRAVLADFGISKIGGMGDKLTASGAVLGTPHYMSPEQTVAGSDVDERSDIYSLGAVGYSMLCGREPFTGENVGQLMYARLVRDPDPIGIVNPAVPKTLADIVMKCLARDRLNRWESADALRTALVDAAAGADERLPEGIRDIPSFGPFALVWLAGWSAFALLTPGPIQRALLVLVALMVPFGLGLHVWLLAGRSVGFTQMIRVALRPPEWWTMYWPQSLRRNSDMWPRLPLAARFCRTALSAFFVFVPGAIVVGELFDPLPGSVSASALLGLEIVTIAITIAGLTGGYLWSKRQSLDMSDTLRLMIGPTGFSSGWNKPSMTRVLSRASGQVRAPDPGDPLDYRRAIGELLPRLPNQLESFRLEALDLAERMADMLQRQSGEVIAMERDAGPAETERLQSRLAALGEGSSDDTRERADLRKLLQTELEVVWRMRDRLEIASRHRAHRFELLRSLYSILCDACERGQDARQADDYPARARVVCDEMKRELDSSALS